MQARTRIFLTISFVVSAIAAIPTVGYLTKDMPANTSGAAIVGSVAVLSALYVIITLMADHS